MLYAFALSLMGVTCPSHLILLDSIILIIMGRSTSYEAPHYSVFSSLLSLNPFLVQIFSSASCSETPTVCVLPIMLETKYNIHTKQLAELYFCMC
jgi:hypothetical protein